MWILLINYPGQGGALQLPGTGPRSVDEARCEQVLCRYRIFQRVRAAHDVECFLHARRIEHAKRLSDEGTDNSGLGGRDVGIDLAVMLVHDHAGFLRIGNRILEAVHSRGHETSNKVRLRFDQFVTGDYAVAVEIESRM